MSFSPTFSSRFPTKEKRIHFWFPNNMWSSSRIADLNSSSLASISTTGSFFFRGTCTHSRPILTHLAHGPPSNRLSHRAFTRWQDRQARFICHEQHTSAIIGDISDFGDGVRHLPPATPWKNTTLSGEERKGGAKAYLFRRRYLVRRLWSILFFAPQKGGSWVIPGLFFCFVCFEGM